MIKLFAYLKHRFTKQGWHSASGYPIDAFGAHIKQQIHDAHIVNKRVTMCEDLIVWFATTRQITTMKGSNRRGVVKACKVGHKVDEP